MRTQEQGCSSNLENYDGFKRFSVDLSPGDSVTLRGDFAAQVWRFCIVKAMGPPQGHSACVSPDVPDDLAIAACTRSGDIGGTALAKDYDTRGLRYRTKGDLSRAIADFTDAIKFDPDSKIAYSHRAQTYLKKGDYPLALHDFDEILRLQPTNSYAWNGRCWARAIIGRELLEALADCEEALRTDPQKAHSLDSRGFTFLKLGRLDNAIADFSAALNLDPNAAGSLYCRGIAKGKKGDAAGSRADIAAAKMLKADVDMEDAAYGIK
jgi:tetratricopeptide (TPR) repeat protein